MRKKGRPQMDINRDPARVCKGKCSRIFPVCFVIPQPLKVSQGEVQKQAWQRKEQRDVLPSLNFSHPRAHGQFPSESPISTNGILKSQQLVQ